MPSLPSTFAALFALCSLWHPIIAFKCFATVRASSNHSFVKELYNLANMVGGFKSNNTIECGNSLVCNTYRCFDVETHADHYVVNSCASDSSGQCSVMPSCLAPFVGKCEHCETEQCNMKRTELQYANKSLPRKPDENGGGNKKKDNSGGHAEGVAVTAIIGIALLTLFGGSLIN
ncbi:hypothetical protein niasHS_017939 [Heterodera schachtii]|uniref:Uncharacterized protein n=2 Tax=Heterodera TaxID=34509 RepID=A0ABD2I549_HETSC